MIHNAAMLRIRVAMLPCEESMNSRTILLPIQEELSSSDKGVCMQQTDSLLLEKMIQECMPNMVVPAVKVDVVDLLRRIKRVLEYFWTKKVKKSNG